MNRTARMSGFFIVAASCVSLLASAADTAGIDQENRWEARSEKKYTVKLDAPPPVQYCQSRTSVEYYQDDQTAMVSGEIDVEGCTNASGTYTISVRYRDDQGETTNLDFDEAWQRNSTEPVSISHAYPIAANVDLIRVRARRTRCICADTETPIPNQAETTIEQRKDQ